MTPASKPLKLIGGTPQTGAGQASTQEVKLPEALNKPSLDVTTRTRKGVKNTTDSLDVEDSQKRQASLVVEQVIKGTSPKAQSLEAVPQDP
ncbi:unnamed protein product [Echinostoma caproni]|uniref:Death-associated protein 1 n=1 Tax=Echinostoma caproni TaxID=27848 RepID=A0A183BEP9_9TREM|nr:unnamed protein product [Echinostoma caproni]